MEQHRYYILPEDEFNSIQQSLRRAIYHCERAEPYDHTKDPAYTYPGATGYSQSAMEDVVGRLNMLCKTVEFD